MGIRGQITARGYTPGTAALLMPTLWAWNLTKGNNAQIGTAAPIPVVLGYAPQPQFVMPNPSPDDEIKESFDALIYLESAVLESLEDHRQGGDFRLQINTTVLLLNAGPPRVPLMPGQVHPMLRDQSMLEIKRADWGTVLQQWGRGVGIPVVVALPEVTVHPVRANIVRFLKEAWQKVDGGDYQGAFVATRKSVELVRELSTATKPIPQQVREQDVDQRLYRVIQALFDLASAEPHADGPTCGYVPSREDAVALVGAAAALTQCVFARMKS